MLTIRTIEIRKNFIIIEFKFNDRTINKKISLNNFILFLELIKTALKCSSKRTIFNNLLIIFKWFDKNSLTI